MSNSLDPEQARRFVGPVLGLNCLQRSSADGNSRQKYVGHLYERRAFIPSAAN